MPEPIDWRVKVVDGDITIENATLDVQLDEANDSVEAYQGGKTANAVPWEVEIANASPVEVEIGIEKAYTTPATGELVGVVAATQLPNIPCKLVRLKARASNTGTVAIGIVGVTMPAGTTTTTAGLELSAGEDTGWIPVDNMNRLYRICSSTAQHLTYMALA